MYQKIYELATNKNLSLEERCSQITAILLPIKDEVMIKNEHWQPRNVLAIENTTGFLLLRNATAEKERWASFFKNIFQNFPHFESFEWEQREDFNDSYHYYNVSHFKMNDENLCIYPGLDGFEFLKEQYWKDNLLSDNQMRDLIWAAFYYDTATEQEVDDFWVNDKVTDAMIKELFQAHFGDAVAAIMVWFQSLFNAFTADYFIGLFAWQSKVKVAREGMYITT